MQNNARHGTKYNRLSHSTHLGRDKVVIFMRADDGAPNKVIKMFCTMLLRGNYNYMKSISQVEGSTNRQALGFVNFVPAYHF